VTALILSFLFATAPSQAESRAIDAESRARDMAERRVNPFEAVDADPFADMETQAERSYREWVVWQMAAEFQAYMEALAKP
jgi:hypothetical protein